MSSNTFQSKSALDCHSTQVFETNDIPKHSWSEMFLIGTSFYFQKLGGHFYFNYFILKIFMTKTKRVAQIYTIPHNQRLRLT
jgi:hypothetical protein